MYISNFLAQAILNQVFRNTAYARPATVHLALYTTNPTAADTGTEVTGGAYARQAITFTAPSAIGGIQTIECNADIVYPVATVDWGTITHLGIRDAASAGNLLYYGPVLDGNGNPAPRTILSSDRARFLQNQLDVTLS